MRVVLAFGGWWLVLTAAWWATALPGQALDGAQGAALWWQLRQQALYLSGVWSIGMMSLVMLLALRRPWMERPLGGMDQVYRLHQWLGMGAAVAAVLHWAAKESSGWIKDVLGTVGRPARDVVLPWALQWRSAAKDVGEWAFYALLVLVVLTLWQRLLPYRPWRKVHRVMPVLYLLLAWHTVALMPAQLWQWSLGGLLGVLLAMGSVGALWSLAGQVGKGRHRYLGTVHAVQLLGAMPGQDPLEVLCALPDHWRGHRPGQFVFVRFAGAEGAHPFTIASAPGGYGTAPDGRTLVRLVIKPLGAYTRSLHAVLQPGQTVSVEGPYGCFDARGNAAREQVWIAGGVGITPFLALLQARQPGMAHAAALEPAHLHYCTRDANQDALLSQLRELCEVAQPSVSLRVHDAAQGQYLQPADLQAYGASLDIWLCGPAGLGQALRQAARSQRGWRMHQEAFQMR